MKLNIFFNKMQGTIFAVALLAFSTSDLHAEQKTAPIKKLKIPHAHDAQFGGRVLMSGDTHIELIRFDAKSILVAFTDKLRDPVAAELLDLRLSLMPGNLKLEAVPTELSNQVKVQLPDGFSQQAELWIVSPLKTPKKGYVSVKRSVNIAIKDIPEGEKSSNHGGHEH